MEADEYGLTRWTRFVARCLEVVAVAGLMWVSWCVFGGAGFFVLSMSLYFQIRRPRAVSLESVKGLRQPANLPTKNSRPPIQVYRLVCSHLRNMASAVDQYSSSQPNQEASLIFDLTSETSTSFFQASRAPVAIARDTEDFGRRTHEGYRGMCSDPVDPDGEVRSCCMGFTIGTWDIAPFVLIIAAGPYIGFLELKKMFFPAGVFECGGISCFINVGQARPSARVRSCRMRFHFDESFIS